MADEHLEAYVSKILEIENAQRNQPLTHEELRDIAENLGMSEGDWQAVQETLNAHLERGLGYLRYDNWEDAITELEQVIILNPAHLAALYGLAQAYQKRYNTTHDEIAQDKAETYAKKCLDIDPGHDPALRLLSELKQPLSTKAQRPNIRQGKQQSSGRRMMIVGIITGLLLLSGVVHFLLLTEESATAPEPITPMPAINAPPPALNAPAINAPAITKSDTTSATLTPGKYNIEVTFDNGTNTGLRFVPDNSMQNVYLDSYSYELAGNFFSNAQELNYLELNVELLDAQGNVVVKDKMRALADHQPTARSGDAIPTKYLEHVRTTTVPELSQARLSIQSIESHPAPDSYASGKSIEFSWPDKPTHLELALHERESVFEPGNGFLGKKEDLRHELVLAIENFGQTVIRELTLRIEYLDADGNALPLQPSIIAGKDAPPEFAREVIAVLRSGANLKPGYKISKAAHTVLLNTTRDKVADYRVTVTEAR